MPSATCNKTKIILLVDDDEDCRTIVRDALETAQAGYRIVEFNNGEQALQRLRQAGQAVPDLVYLDVEMPGLSGLDVLQCLHADPELRSVPVVMLTGSQDEEYRRLALQRGARAFARKPIAPAELYRIVQSLAEGILRSQPAQD